MARFQDNGQKAELIRKLKCHICCEHGYTSLRYGVTVRDMPTIVVLYGALTPEEKASVQIASYFRAKVDLSHQNTNHTPKPAVPSVDNPVPTTVVLSKAHVRVDLQPPLAPNVAPISKATEGN